ncbi:MAG: bifunctional glutamate N-acetyltransferase/amino-acid acetyltransferase ArgJ [Dehalococcoidales bacterium]|jgi:glutamate N-acetyltransferase/amino-acid N-acetyltransferase|nr:bifunctional glutamate N-acetyltransferase/amino-acid acetyltransferase ArgJ [Dehalococcoidales bacterium]
MEIGKIDIISDGTVTSPQGFHAGATSAGIKNGTDKLDLGILFSETPCVTAGLFTGSRIKAAAVTWSQQTLKKGKAQAIVVNSGCANAYTGEQGLADAAEMAALAARGIGLSPEDVLVTSTGVTGQPLPLELIEAGLSQVVLSGDGGHQLARAIMTTDTVPKEIALVVGADGGDFTIGGIAKGSGMIHPDLGTMFGFLTTDAAVELDFLKSALRQATDVSFNMITIDGDTSPSDTVLLMANGLAGNEPIRADSPEAEIFQQALERVCIHLAKALARDGEGASRLIEVTVDGAISLVDARSAAKTVTGSTLVKTAVYGADPNWGRIVMALGRSGVEVAESKIDLLIGDVAVLKNGKALSFSEEMVRQVFRQSEVPISVNLNLGTGSATAWGCDLTPEYVAINSHYMT